MKADGYRFSVAPMMGWTDRHCRALMRLFTRRAWLYSEMITADAVIHGDRARLLAHDPRHGPVALQLGGSDPGLLALAAAIGADFGYDEINLNVGCPSDRVRSGRFGACLMAEPKLVASCVRAMKRSVGVPVTVKCRIGIDGQEPARVLPAFAARVADAGADALIVHARKAWLEGVSPRENRELPPLDHALVHRLRAAMPDLPVVINGGIRTLDAARAHLAHVDGVMLGRSAYQTPELLGRVDRDIFGDRDGAREAGDVVRRYLDHVGRECAAGTPLAAMTRHMLGLYHGAPGARAWRRHLSQHCRRTGAGPRVVLEALELVRRAREATAQAA